VAGEAFAGGFAIREQSAYFQGLAFAGAAAGGPSLSSMFWNPATMTQAGPGLTTESIASGIFGRTNINPTSAANPALPGLLGLGASGDIADDAFVPASYMVYRPSPDLAVGLSMNSPWGLVTAPRTQWAGMFYARESRVFSFNGTLMAAYQVNPWLSVGAGVQVQYFRVRLEQAFPGSGVPGVFPDTLRLKGDSTDVGFVAGVTLTPSPWTTIGIGFRSGIDHKLEGTVSRPAFLVPVPPIFVTVPAATTDITATVPLPESVNVGIRQRVTVTLTVLGTFEWTNWSRLGTIPVNATPAGVPGIPTGLGFEWEDGWFASGGLEYQWGPQWAARAGFGFEHSPVTDRVRPARLPDNDRYWLGLGLSYNYSEKLSFDIGYSHIFVKDSPINIGPGHPAFNPALGTFTGIAKSDVDIISVGFRYRWGAGAPAPLVTKG
jgi:long-chain fatty acid transport protein